MNTFGKYAISKATWVEIDRSAPLLYQIKCLWRFLLDKFSITNTKWMCTELNTWKEEWELAIKTSWMNQLWRGLFVSGRVLIVFQCAAVITPTWSQTLSILYSYLNRMLIFELVGECWLLSILFCTSLMLAALVRIIHSLSSYGDSYVWKGQKYDQTAMESLCKIINLGQERYVKGLVYSYCNIFSAFNCLIYSSSALKFIFGTVLAKE